MQSRWLKMLATAMLVVASFCSPAFAQGRNQPAPPQGQKPKPVGQYILLVILLAIPFGLVCRSSRRM
jgi:hypothetical protein